MKKSIFLTNLFLTLLASPIFCQVGTPFSVTSTDSTICVGQSTTLSVQMNAGTIASLSCSSAINEGNLFVGTAASNVSFNVTYSGGNGGMYDGQTILSTGVTGLTASLTDGVFNAGAGNLIYTITGTPSVSGIASFALSIGGRSCTVSVNVYGEQPSYPAGSVFCNGATIVNDVTNPTTGRTWMDRNLGASQVATSSTDANAYGDLYQWGRRSDGHQCRNSATTTALSSTDQPGNGNFILAPNSPFDWRSPQNNNLWQGVNGLNNPCPSGYRLPTETEINAELLSWSENTSLGAFSSPLKLSMPGYRFGSDGLLESFGNVGSYFSSTVASILLLQTDIAFISGGDERAGGCTVRCIKETVGSIGVLNCGSSTVTGNLISGVTASGVSASVPYTGGNSGFYESQSISSTGVTGLTATISQGLFASGAGNLVYTISGTPSADGTASFAISIGGKSCTISIATLGSYYPAGSVFCASGPTVIKEVTNPTTGKTWMDRNLGASRVATSSTDAQAYGDLYQWGRGADGHQCRTSPTTTILSSIDQPAHGNFILTSNLPNDWRSPQNTNLWQDVDGLNIPCPIGYRLPTLSEFNQEKLFWVDQGPNGAFQSALKLPLTGYRKSNDGTISLLNYGLYWTSDINGTTSSALTFYLVKSIYRGYGLSIRCIKN